MAVSRKPGISISWKIAARGLTDNTRITKQYIFLINLLSNLMLRVFFFFLFIITDEHYLVEGRMKKGRKYFI